MQDNNSNITIVVSSNQRKPGNSTLTDQSSGHPRKSRKLLKIILIILILIMASLFAIAIKAQSLISQVFVGQKTSFFQTVNSLFRGSQGSIKLTGEDMGQINILLLGIGGEGHDGPYLSDTLITAQIRPDLQTAALTSIPRDYLVDLPGLGPRKINAAFAEGFAKNKNFNEAGNFALQTAEKISGLKIPYFAVIDFNGFKKAIDQVGGLEIAVERTFTDYTYPDNKNGYLPPQTFQKGLEVMSGERALVFARSRHAAGPEGSDFARSQRQQKIIRAFKDKVINLNLITDAGKLNSLLNTFANHFHTNISIGEMMRLYELGKNFSKDSIVATSLDPATKIICPQILPDTGAYVLAPCNNKTEQDVKEYFTSAFTLGRLTNEKPRIWLAASSETSLEYEAMSEELKNNGLEIFFVKSSLNPAKTGLFQVNPKPNTAKYLIKTYGMEELTSLPPDFKTSPEKVDIVVLLAEKAPLISPTVKPTHNKQKK